MVKALFLGLLAATMCGLARAAPAAAPSTPPPDRAARPEGAAEHLEDPAARSERSTNLSLVTGVGRKIQMILKDRPLEILPDGAVGGTTDPTSAYTILQRTTVGIGLVKIQGVATCQYLCMNSCGLLYGSRKCGDECIFNETIAKHNYNIYSSTKYSNGKQTLYLALNGRGQSKMVLLRARQQLGRLSSSTRVLTRTVPAEMAEDLHPVRHHPHMCDPTAACPRPAPPADRPADPPRARKRKRRKKKKCDRNSEKCQRELTMTKKKHKTNGDPSDNKSACKKRRPKGNVKSARKRQGLHHVHHAVTTSTEASPTPPEDTTPDQDYGPDSTTHWDWEDSTAVPDMSMSLSTGVNTPAQHD